MFQSNIKMKDLTRVLRAILLALLILWALQPMGALGETLSNWHLMTVNHPNLPGGHASAGVMFLGSGNLYSTYCINLHIYTYLGLSYTRGSDLNNAEISYILNNYYPVVAEKPSGMSAEFKGAAVQLAIWHYSDNLDISSGGTPSEIFDAARSIIADTDSNYLKTYSLSFDPLSAICVGSEMTIRARLTLGSSPVQGKSVSFSVAGSNTATGTATTDSDGYATFKYIPQVGGKDAITATVQDIIPAGVIWVSQGYQALVMAKKNPLSNLVSLSVNPSPVVSAIGASICEGNTATLLGSVTTANCAAGSILTYKWYGVEGSTETSLTDGPKYTGTGTLTLNILNAVPADAGTYRLKVTCSGTQCTGVADAVLSITSPIVSATGTAVCAGNTAHLAGSVTTENCPAGSILTYKWYRVAGSSETSLTDGPKYTGTGTLTLNILNAVPADAGTYRLKVTCSGTQCTGVADAILSQCGSITVTKDAIPNDGTLYSAKQFTFRSDSLGPFTLVDDGTGQSNSKTFDNLKPGDYQIVEQSQSGWTLNAINCDGAKSEDLPNGNGKIIHLGVGESATVKFVNTQSISPNPSIELLKIKKTALNTSVHRGEDISYTIEVCAGPLPLTNVNVVDVLPKEVELVCTSPDPTTSLTWHKDTLDPGECFEVALTVRVPVIDFHYDMSQGVKGEGFVNVYNNYDTTVNPSLIRNCAYATADGVGTVSDCANTTVIEEPGTQLKRREFGSGVYASEELSKVRSENKSIITDTSLQASYRPSSFSLPQGRSINYNTLWTEKSKARNTVTGASMTEEYTSASKINKDRSIEMDKNGSIMTTEVEFEGQGHIGVLKKENPDSHPKVKPIFESREDYAGKFKIYEKVDEYGTSVVSNKSTSGFGYVAVDKNIGDSQRTYESGTGSYQSEELIDTPTSYIAKNISLVHMPAGYSYSPSFRADQDMKWSEGMWSKSEGLRGGDLIANNGPSWQIAASSCLANGSSPGTLISEKYSYLDNLKRDTVASGLNDMKTQASFSGMADYKVLSHGTNGTSEVDNEERYVGRYDINRHALLTGVSKYDIPHLTIIKEGQIKNEWYNNVNATQAEYAITITNDGNRAFAPIYVRDLFPAGTQYVKSTIRPASLTASEANWTLTNLGIGNTITIGLTLNVTEGAPGNNLVNRVVACGMSGDKSICAGNYSSLEFGWLTCCPPKVLVSKKAWLDEDDPTVVHYRIIVDNKAPESVAVTVTDQLTGGMTLLGASVLPNTYDANQIVWALPEIKPGHNETIDYAARVSRDGGYSSAAHIDATAINGTGYDTMDAAAYIEVTRTGVAPKTFRYGGWEPPAWNLSSPEPGLNMDPELEVEPGVEG